MTHQQVLAIATLILLFVSSSAGAFGVYGLGKKATKAPNLDWFDKFALWILMLTTWMGWTSFCFKAAMLSWGME